MGVVYSTEYGRMCPSCGRPSGRCACGSAPSVPAGDGIVRVRRETKGRNGKTVTAVYGLPPDPDGLKRLCSEIKRRLGTGGSEKDGILLLQGDRCDAVVQWLSERGYRVQRAGG